MSGTFSSLHAHIVFATKGREDWLTADWRDDLHQYLGGTVRGLGAHSLIVGGVSDHVHLLIGLRPKHAISDVVKELKVSSHHWIKTHHGPQDFAWQDGFGAFSICREHTSQLISYIQNQEEHHRGESARDEFIRLCIEFGVSPDERYVE